MFFPSCANLYPQCLIHSWDSSTMTSFFLFEFSYAEIYFSIVCEPQEALLMQLPKGNPLIKLKRRILRIPWFHSPFYRYEKASNCNWKNNSSIHHNRVFGFPSPFSLAWLPSSCLTSAFVLSFTIPWTPNFILEKESIKLFASHRRFIETHSLHKWLLVELRTRKVGEITSTH